MNPLQVALLTVLGLQHSPIVISAPAKGRVFWVEESNGYWQLWRLESRRGNPLRVTPLMTFRELSQACSALGAGFAEALGTEE